MNVLAIPTRVLRVEDAHMSDHPWNRGLAEQIGQRDYIQSVAFDISAGRNDAPRLTESAQEDSSRALFSTDWEEVADALSLRGNRATLS